MAGDLKDDLHAEMARLRAENDILRSELQELRAAINGSGRGLVEAFGMTKTHARIVALLMSGRSYSWSQIGDACGREWSEQVVRALISQLRNYPVIEVPRASAGNGWHLTDNSIAELERGLSKPALPHILTEPSRRFERPHRQSLYTLAAAPRQGRRL